MIFRVAVVELATNKVINVIMINEYDCQETDDVTFVTSDSANIGDTFNGTSFQSPAEQKAND